MIQLDDNDTPSRNVLLKMLSVILMEIRISEDLKMVHSLSDIFHNLPGHLAMQWNEERAKKAYNDILNKSKKNKLKNYILDLRKSAECSFGKSKNK
ncbi:MAG: hypothetical protein MJK11_07570 [Pseudomonadales bacterium]|nr:hypothetical protein [Pseudomonadales bacterium]